MADDRLAEAATRFARRYGPFRARFREHPLNGSWQPAHPPPEEQDSSRAYSHAQRTRRRNHSLGPAAASYSAQTGLPSTRAQLRAASECARQAKGDARSRSWSDSKTPIASSSKRAKRSARRRTKASM